VGLKLFYESLLTFRGETSAAEDRTIWSVPKS